MKTGWEKEFGSEYEPPEPILSLIERDGVTDRSWHNDAVPSIERVCADGSIAILGFAHPDQKIREIDDFTHRFSVWFMNTDDQPVKEDETLLTDDPVEARNHFLKY